MKFDKDYRLSSEIIKALSLNYFTGFIIDAVNDSFEALPDSRWRKDIPSSGSYSQFIDFYASKYLYEDDQYRVKQAMSLANLQERLSHHDQQLEFGLSYYVDYTSKRFGYEHFCRCSILPLHFDNDGHIVRMLALLQDITQQRKEEQELQQHSRKVLDALCADYLGAYIVDLNTGKMEIIKARHYFDHTKIFGKHEKNALPFPRWVELCWQKLIVHDTFHDFLSCYDMAKLKARMLKQDSYVSRFRSKPDAKGHEWFELKIVNFYEDEHSYKVILGFRAVDEIVAQERERSELVKEKQQSDLIKSLATIYAVIITLSLKDRHYEVIESGPIIDAILGKNGNADEVIDTAIKSFIDAAYRPVMREFLNFDNLASRLQNKNVISCEYLDPQGNWYEPCFIVKKRDASGQAEQVIYACRDVTETKRYELMLQQNLKENAEEARRANISKTAFLRRMSHDIRTPLNGIIGMLHVATRYEQDLDRLHECREKILASADYLLDLVNNVLDISKLESGVLVLENNHFNLKQLVNKITSIVEQTAQENGLVLEVDPYADKLIHTDVVGSDLHLKRILMNVASNAIKYNRKGGKIRLSCRELPSNHDKAIFEFVCCDNGLGMSDEFLQLAFEPFTQEGKETITSFAGSGLGLSIVKEIVELMGGTVTLASKEHVGTTVTITVPLKIDRDKEKLPIIKSDDKKDIDLVGINALLVEDNKLNMEIASIMLEDLGLNITKAHNGKEALDIFERSKLHEFKLIFMDVVMPVMDGLEATLRLRGLEREDAKTVPIIAMTANAFSEDKKVCLDAGMNDHIGKPIQIERLKQVIHNNLNGC